MSTSILHLFFFTCFLLLKMHYLDHILECPIGPSLKVVQLRRLFDWTNMAAALLQFFGAARHPCFEVSGGNERSGIGGVRNYRNSCANQNRVHFVIFPRLYVRRGLETTTVWCETRKSREMRIAQVYREWRGDIVCLRRDHSAGELLLLSQRESMYIGFDPSFSLWSCVFSSK